MVIVCTFALTLTVVLLSIGTTLRQESRTVVTAWLETKLSFRQRNTIEVVPTFGPPSKPTPNVRCVTVDMIMIVSD